MAKTTEVYMFGSMIMAELEFMQQNTIMGFAFATFAALFALIMIAKSFTK